MNLTQKPRAKRNQTLTLEDSEIETLSSQILTLADFAGEGSRTRSADCSDNANFADVGNCTVKDDNSHSSISPTLPDILDKTLNMDIFDGLKFIPDEFADLIIIDPPYNLTKNFNGKTFTAMKNSDYLEYLRSWFPLVVHKLKPSGSLYLCGDWKCTSSLQTVLEEHLTVLNRITWQREKGRGAKSNWKNSMEDIWFAVKNPNDYYFNVDAVKLKRKVLAPYKVNGTPKDWQETNEGNFRITYPSNFWDDISVPFWSMSENTDHPTQKPEKLYAKLILASSKEGDIVFDPFLGSGTTSAVATKLNRHFCGIELNKEYSLIAQKRINLARSDKSIQGYNDGVFWERNTKEGIKK